MQFIDFVGNEKAKQQLTFLQVSNRLPHAIIIEGDEGLGKRTLAREIALNLFCRNDEPPCRNCPQCSKVLKGYHPDIFEYSASGGARSFHVDVVRDVRDSVFVQPNEADYKIYILGNCQCMSESAQNALLKVLEEPPAYVLFILTVNSKSALLETVLSRSVVISLEGVPEKIAADYICSRDENIDYEDAVRAAALWNGNIGKAIESLGDSKLSKISEIANSVCEALLEPAEYSLLTVCATFDRDRETLISTLTLLKTMFRDAMLYAMGSDILSGQNDTVVRLFSNLSKPKLMHLMNTCDNIKSLALKNGNHAILITKMCYDFRKAIGR